MILFEQKPTTHFSRVLKVVFHPGILILKIIVIAIVAAYFIAEAFDPPINKGPFIFSLFFFLFILFFLYRHLLKTAATQITKVEVTAKGLTLHQQNRDIAQQHFVPMVDLHMDLRKIYSKKRYETWYKLYMFEADKGTQLFDIDFSNNEIALLFQTMDQEKWRPLKAEERDFLIWHERTKDSVITNLARLRTQFQKITIIMGLLGGIAYLADIIFFDGKYSEYFHNLFKFRSYGK